MENFSSKLEKVSVIVRKFESKEMYEISLIDWHRAENEAGSQSAFAESRGVLNNGFVEGTEMKVHEFLSYRN